VKRVLAAATVGVLLLGACGGGAAAAATVNDVAITADDVRSLVYDGTDLASDQFTQLLDILVQWSAIADAAEADFGVVPTTDEIAAKVDELYQQQGAGATFDDFLQSQGISEKGLNLYAEQLLIGDAVLDPLTADLKQPTEEEAQQALAEDPQSWTEVCAAHILVGTSEEADDVINRLNDGEDFATVAAEVSLDTTSGAAGGDLGCAPASSYVSEFADATMTAEIGAVVGPVETSYGFHVIRVDSRTESSIADIQSGLYDDEVAAAVDDWYLASVSSAAVTVDPQYGEWVTDPYPSISTTQ
jgi:foldase protein PrsA